jgi:prophage regulatory protein
MLETMRGPQKRKQKTHIGVRRSARTVGATEWIDGSSGQEARDALIARLTDLHGRSSEIVRRMTDDARVLSDVHRETSVVLSKLWTLQLDTPRPPVSAMPSDSMAAASPPAPTSAPRFLRFPEVAKRIGLSRSSVWRLQRAGRFPQHRRLSPNTVGWWEPEIEAWLQSRQLR